MQSILTYNGYSITQRPKDGYVNATEMAKANCVKVDDFLKTATNKAYIAELARTTNIREDLICLVKNGSPEFGGGTWMHPLLALNFGRWISPNFAIWCDQHIKTLIETGETKIENNTTPDFSDPLVAAKLYIEAETERRRLKTEAIANQPLVDFAIAVSNTENYPTLSNFFREANIGRNRGFSILRSLGIILKSSPLPYQKYVDSGHFTVILKITETAAGKRQDPVCCVTPKGQLFVHKKLAEFARRELTLVQMESAVELIG